MTPRKDRITRRALLKSSAAAAASLIVFPSGLRAQAADSVKLSLEFRIYGGNAPMFLAAENGIFRDLKLDVSSDGSAGSSESLTRVATWPPSVSTASSRSNPGCCPAACSSGRVSAAR